MLAAAQRHNAAVAAVDRDLVALDAASKSFFGGVEVGGRALDRKPAGWRRLSMRDFLSDDASQLVFEVEMSSALIYPTVLRVGGRP